MPPLNPAVARESGFSERWGVALAQRLRGRRPWPVRCWRDGGRGSPDGPGAGHASEALGDIPECWGGVVPRLSVPPSCAAGLGMPWRPRGTGSAVPTHAGSGVAGVCKHLPNSARACGPDAMDATTATRMPERRPRHVRGVSDAFGIEKLDPADGKARDVPRPDPTGSDAMRQSSAGHGAEGSWSAGQRGIGNGTRPERPWPAWR